MSKKIIAVVGATGAQGGGLVRSVLADPEGEFVVRALTRDPNSERAKALAHAGAEVVRADLEDQASLRAAFDGVHGAFLLTNYWEHRSTETEQAHARNMAQAAAAAGVRHAIWSTLPDTRNVIPVNSGRAPVIDGRFISPHFDGKAEADAYFIEAGVPTTFLRTTFYFEAWLTFFPPSRLDDGTLAITVPMGDRRLSGIAVEDIGRIAHAVFRQGEKHIGATVSIAGEHLTGNEYAQQMTEVLGQTVVYRPASLDAFRSSGFAGAEDLGNMFQYYQEAEAEYIRDRNVVAIRSLHPALQDFRTWLLENRSRFA